MNEPSGDWIQTFTGGRFYPACPLPCHINIEDIARALSRLCRYAGHCEHFYSVAQHSVYVSSMVPLEHQRAALMHDATEAYLVDLPRPVKNLLPDYRKLEQMAWVAIAEEFGLPFELPKCVKDADNRVLLREKELILKPSAPWTQIPVTPAPIDIVRMDCDQAYAFFMRRFALLFPGRV